MGNWQLEDLIAAIHEFHTWDNYHKNIDELVEEEIYQETEEKPQDPTKNITNDDSSSLLAEAQEDIQPQIQSSQEIENCCTSVQRNTETSPPLTEEEIDQIINKKPTSETFYKTNTLAHSPNELCCKNLEISLVDKNKERL